jgi:hypothetical protein
MPSTQRVTDQQLEGQVNHDPTSPADATKMGAPRCHPTTALQIRGSEPDPRRVRTGTPDRQSQGRPEHVQSSLTSRHQLEGVLHVVFKSQRGQLVEGYHRRRASSPSVPIERD